MMNMTQTWHSGKALYYPYINIQDPNWLKSSLLYWDGIRRIMPPDARLQDSPEVREAVAAGVLEDISPVDYRHEASQKFIDKIKPFLRDSSVMHKLDKLFDDSLLANASRDFETINNDQIIRSYSSPGGRGPADIWNIQDFGTVYSVDQIYHSQIDSEALDILSTFRFKGNPDGDSAIAHVYRVQAFVGGFYRLCLANEMANRIGVPLVTDMPQISNCSEYVSFGQGGAAVTSEKGVLIKLNIDFPAPESLQEVTMSNILSYHRQREGERRQFRKAIESILSIADNLEDPIALADYFQDQGKEIRVALEDHKKTLNELNVKSVSSLLTVSAPTAIVAAAGLVVPPAAVALTGIGIAVSLVNWWAEVRSSRREAKHGSPWHYLISTKESFG